MIHFTPLASLTGGVLIGLAAVTLMLLNGRIAGVSGITAGLLSFDRQVEDIGWRIAFVIGLIVGPLLLMSVTGEPPGITPITSVPFTVTAGLLVGYGTVLGNGCTSGHGVCGIARLSTRSLIATLVFMTSGAATTFVFRHLLTGG